MKVMEFAELLGMKVLTSGEGIEKDITGMYICDLLSWVMSRANKGDAWVTVHTHMNIVAVALLSEIPCIIIPENIDVEEPTLKKASQEGIAILSTDKNAFRIALEAGKLL
ncbi:MAG: DRTGG domain-containing protein [Bacillota bacterium]